MKKYQKKTFKKRQNYKGKVAKYTPKYTSQKYLSLSTKQLYLPIPQVFNLRLTHEQDYSSPAAVAAQVQTFLKFAVSARGLDIGADNPVGTAWTYPAGMKSMHCLYSLSWIESMKVTCTVMLTSNTAGVNCVFFKGNVQDYSTFVDGAGIQLAGQQPPYMDANRYDSVRSRMDSVSLSTSRRDGGNPMVQHTYTIDNKKISKEFCEDLAYATYSDRSGQMAFPDAIELPRSPVLGVVIKPLLGDAANAPTYWIRWKIEYNIRMTNLHPLQSKNNIAFVN